MSIQPPRWIRVLCSTMRNVPVGSTSGKNVEIARATAPTMTSPRARGLSGGALFTRLRYSELQSTPTFSTKMVVLAEDP